MPAIIQSQNKTAAAGENGFTFTIPADPDNPAVLIAASIVEADATGTQVNFDTANLWVQIGQSAVSLKVGWMMGNGFNWQGRVPIDSSMEIKAVVYHARSGQNLKASIMYEPPLKTKAGGNVPL